MPRAWLTPDSPTPEEERCRTISVPDDLAFVGAVTGALLPLTQPDNWEQSGSMTPEEAAGIMSAAFESFVDSDCTTGEPCPPPTLPDGSRVWRRNPTTGNWEYLDDTGENWVEPTGEDAIPAPVAREEATSDEMKCAASTNAVGVIKELYDQILSDINEDVDTVQMGLNLAYVAGTRLGGAFYPPVVAILTSAAAIWNGVIETIQAFTVNLWDDRFTDTMVCIFLDNATETNGVVTFDFQAINRDALEQIWESSQYVLLVSQFIYLMSVIGPQGVNVAGGVTVLEGDCNDCGEWCYTFNFAFGSQGWVACRETTNYYSAYGTYDGTKWNSSLAISSGGGYEHSICVGRQFDSTTLTSVSVTFQRTNGQFAAQIYAERWWLNNWDNQASLGTKTVIRTALTPGATGTVTYTTSGTWQNIAGLTLTCVSSYRASAIPNPAGTASITSITLTGTGVNPFGQSNC